MQWLIFCPQVTLWKLNDNFSDIFVAFHVGMRFGYALKRIFSVNNWFVGTIFELGGNA